MMAMFFILGCSLWVCLDIIQRYLKRRNDILEYEIQKEKCIKYLIEKYQSTYTDSKDYVDVIEEISKTTNTEFKECFDQIEQLSVKGIPLTTVLSYINVNKEMPDVMNVQLMELGVE